MMKTADTTSQTSDITPPPPPPEPEPVDPTRFGDWEKNGRCIDF